MHMKSGISCRINGGLSRFVRSRPFGGLLSTVAALLFVCSGYYLTYQLFFIELPVEDLAWAHEGGRDEKFRYDGVAYFKGFGLGDKEQVRIKYHSNRILDLCKNKKVEIFLRIDQVEKESEKAAGTLYVTQSASGKKARSDEVPLKCLKLQRCSLPMLTKHVGANVLKIRFESADISTVDHIVLATNIRHVSFWPQIIVFFLSGLILLICRTILVGSWNRGETAAIILTLAVMFFFHSGAFISNEYITETSSAYQQMARQVKTLLETGHFDVRMYRGPGYTLVPLLSAWIEGAGKPQIREFVNNYPTPRYIMFAWTSVCLVVLLRVLYRRLSPGIALLSGLLFATFYPFIVDLYFIMDDAYLFPAMMLFTAAYIRYVTAPGLCWRGVVYMALILFFMITVKIIPAFLVLLVPFSTWCQAVWQERRICDKRSLILAVALLFAMILGRGAGDVLIDAKSREIVEGEAYAKSQAWEVLWAANGLYDHHSAHDFTKSGGLRTKRVAEATGLPEDISHIRHAEVAAEKIYKPGVMNMLKERPGYMYATAFLRHYVHGISFYRYTYGGYMVWENWLNDGFRADEIIGGEQVYGLTTEREKIRYGKMWKISPLVLLTKFVQGDMTRLSDVMLIVAFVIGTCLIRRIDIGVFFLGCFAAKMAYLSGIHGITRHMNFVNVVMIIGLAAFFLSFIKCMRNPDVFGRGRPQA